MGLWQRLFADSPAAPARDPSDDFWFEGRRARAEMGQIVTIERARKVPVVRDALQVLSSTAAGLQKQVFERAQAQGRDERREAIGHPVTQLFRAPSPRVTEFEFFATLFDDLAAHGNFYAETVYGDVGAVPSSLFRIDPRYVSVEELPDRSVRLRLNEPGRAERILVEGEFWHIPLPPLVDGLRGRSPILDDGIEAIGSAIALQDYANRFFTNDATPPFVFMHPGNFKDKDSKTNFLNAWQRLFSGRNRHRPGVLEYGMQIQKLGVNNEEAQFLETRKEGALDVARLWRMPPHKIGILDRATFSNIEHQSLEFVTDTLGPFLELVESSINRHLIADPRQYFQFNVASLLRGDIKTRFEAYAQARQWGWLSVNEIRRMENQNNIGPAGDRYIEPMNMVPAGADREPMPAAAKQTIRFLRSSVVHTQEIKNDVA